MDMSSSPTYKVTVGLEVHAELSTVSKMFCGCKNSPHDAVPNTFICPVCVAHPGTLPTPNESAIQKVLLFGSAVGATVASYSEFDRKNYFYPDIPKAYQISQYAYPFLTGGSIAGVTLTRVHLEEDTARSQHDTGEGSLIDFNRAGVPLMELVTEPVIHDAEMAGNFAKELQIILRTLEISEAHMERGQMRVEANISVSATDVLGTKVEVKNLNSFKSVMSAIDYETERQIAVLNRGESVAQETRGWDEIKGKTFTQRTKETAKDYRYFPDPDLPKMNILLVSRLNEKNVKMPNEIRLEYTNLGLTSNQIEIFLASAMYRKFFDEVYSDIESSDRIRIAQLSANYITSDLMSLLAPEAPLHIQSNYFLELIQMLLNGEINSRIAKDLLGLMVSDPTIAPREYATDHDLLQIQDDAALDVLVATVIEKHSQVADEYRAGKESVLQFLVGQGMKESRGKADPEALAIKLKEMLART